MINCKETKIKKDLTWWSTVGQWAFWPFPNHLGVAHHQVILVWWLHLHLLERRGSWWGGRPGRNERGRDEERGSRTRLRLNWPDEKQAGLATLRPSNEQRSETQKPAEQKKKKKRRLDWEASGGEKTNRGLMILMSGLLKSKLKRSHHPLPFVLKF